MTDTFSTEQGLPCNLAALYDLMGDHEVVAEVCRLFLVTSFETREAMGRLAGLDEDREFAREAHKLKGACGHIQAMRLRAICEELERSSEHVAIRWERLRGRLDAELAEVRSHLSEQLGPDVSTHRASSD